MSSMKKVLLIGFIIVLLIAIPVTVFLVQQQQKTKSAAVAATTISILPASQAPIHVGDDVTLNIQVNPATATTTNLVSFVKFTILYDSTKIATDGAGFVADTTVGLPTILKGPTYGTGTISITLSAGGNAQKVIQNITNIGAVTFKAIATTDSAPTQITFGTDTQVLSLGTSDQFNENVLASANPAVLTIIGGDVTPTPTVTIAPTPTATPTPVSNAPTCSSLTADTTSGTAPLSTNLTVTGASNNSTISKVTFNFGDGQSQDITASGGIGTNSVSVLQSHSYTTAGTFNASATLTDANSAVSSSTNCTLTITVGGGTTTTTNTTTVVTAPTATPTPVQQVIAQPSPLPPTGPADLIKIGSIGAVIMLIGAVLLFAL
jgi:trimeric autotransporter adhesin